MATYLQGGQGRWRARPCHCRVLDMALIVVLNLRHLGNPKSLVNSILDGRYRESGLRIPRKPCLNVGRILLIHEGVTR